MKLHSLLIIILSIFFKPIEAQFKCIGCALQKNEASSIGGIIAETPYFEARQDCSVPIPGFIIISSKRHIQSILDFTTQERIDFIEFVYHVRKASQEVLGIDQVYMIQEEDASHYHLWLFPWQKWMHPWDQSLKSVRPIMKYAKKFLNTAENLKLVAEHANQLRENLMLKNLINSAQKFLQQNPWTNLIENQTPQTTGCGLVYECGKFQPDLDADLAIVDMRQIIITEPHYHPAPNHEIYLILKGSARVIIGYTEHVIQKSEVLVIPPDITHYTLPDTECVMAVVNTPPFKLENYCSITKSNAEFKFDEQQFKSSIKQKLADMVTADQSLRSRLDFLNLNDSLMHEISSMDIIHTQQLKNILGLIDWPTISNFGLESDQHAWILVQHADHDIAFQKEVLDKLKKLQKIQETDSKNFAYLYDRIAMNEKLPQRYGTQGLIENGKWVLYDTQDFPNLDQRRLEMGLSTYQDYKDQLASMYKLQG